MPKAGSTGDAPKPTRSGPPPLRERPTPKPKERDRFTWRNVAKVFSSFSIGALRRDLSHFLVWGLWIFVAIFAIGAFQSFTAGNLRDEEEGTEADIPVIATIGRQNLDRQKFNQILDRYNLRRSSAMAYLFQQTGQIYDQWVQEEVLRLEAHRRGIKVTGGDIDAKIDEFVQQKLEADRAGLSDAKWRYKLQQEGTTAEKVADAARQEFADQRPDIETSLLLERVVDAIKGEVKVDDAALRDKYEEVKARAILVKTKTRKPFPPPEGVQETEDEVAQRAQQEQEWKASLQSTREEAEKRLARIQPAPTRFAELAKTLSDDYTAENGGDLGSFTRERARFGDAFKDAVFKLKPGEVSGLIEGDEGWVVATVESRKAWPDDFNKPDPRDFETAKKIADGLEKQLAGGADFATLARRHSEDPGSKDKGGEYEMTGRGMWVKPFEKVAFGLEVDEISPPVRTQFGWHIIQCLERKLYEGDAKPPEEEAPDPESDDAMLLKELPKLKNADIAPAEQVRVRHILIKAEDPKQKIEDLREQLEQQKQGEHVQKVLDEMVKKAYDDGTIKVEDPMIRAYLARKENDSEAEQFWLMRAAGAYGYEHPEVHFELAQILQRANSFGVDTKPQVAAAKALQAAGGPEATQALIAALDSFYPDVKRAAAEALGQMQAKEAVGRLQELYAAEMDDATKKTIGEALEKLGAKPAGGEAEATPKPAAAAPKTGLAEPTAPN